MSSFGTTNQIFDNAREFEVRHHRLQEFPPVDQLVDEITSWFREIGSEDDDWVPTIRSKLWRLRTTVLCSLLTFDDPELELAGSFDSLRHEANRLPPLRNRLSVLGEKLQALLEQHENPKRAATHALLQQTPPRDGGLGLVTAIVRGTIPGWSDKLRAQVREMAPDCRFIGSARRLYARSWKQILLVSGSPLCPFIYDLYQCSRTSRLDVITYSSEGLASPNRRSLPGGSGMVTRRSRQTTPTARPSAKSESAIEESGQAAVWETMRRAALTGTEHHVANRTFLVDARLVLLANDMQVLLQEASKVIELSELDTQNSVPGVVKRFPRRPVADLADGDLIVLRTSGSGDYLIDAADALMKKDGKGDLRERALDWKPVLRKALEDHGADELARRLAARNHRVSNPTYIWMWTTDLVIRPRSEALFYELMAILDDLGYQSRHGHLLRMIESRWASMKEIIMYHQRAGSSIRRTLLSRLREVMEEGTAFEDEYRLTLDDLDAGELAVFRVAAIDIETIRVPYHQVGILAPAAV